MFRRVSTEPSPTTIRNMRFLLISKLSAFVCPEICFNSGCRVSERVVIAFPSFIGVKSGRCYGSLEFKWSPFRANGAAKPRTFLWSYTWMEICSGNINGTLQIWTRKTHCGRTKWLRVMSMRIVLVVRGAKIACKRCDHLKEHSEHHPYHIEN